MLVAPLGMLPVCEQHSISERGTHVTALNGGALIAAAKLVQWQASKLDGGAA